MPEFLRPTNGTTLIPQPSHVFIYNRRTKQYHSLNMTCWRFMDEMDGKTCCEAAIERLAETYDVETETLAADFLAVVDFLQSMGYVERVVEACACRFPLELEERRSELKLQVLQVELTNRCNLNCAYCCAETNTTPADRPTSFWLSVLDRFHRAGLRAVTITGGEPLLHEGFMDVMEFCADRFIVSLCTNGAYVDSSVARRLAGMGLRSTQVSLDSVEPGHHDKMRGRGSWKQAMRAIGLLRERGVPLRISTTVTAENTGELAALREFCLSRGIDYNPDSLIYAGRGANLSESLACVGIGVESFKTTVHVGLRTEPFEVACQGLMGQAVLSAEGYLKPCDQPNSFFERIAPDLLTVPAPAQSYKDTVICRALKVAYSRPETSPPSTDDAPASYRCSKCDLARLRPDDIRGIVEHAD